MNSDRSLPNSWSSTTLGAIREDRSASVDPSKCKLERFELYSIPAFPSGVPEVVTGAEIGSTKKSLSPGTVVVSKINPRINRVWVVGGNTGRRQIGSSEWIPFFPVNGIDPKYLAYFLRQDSFRNYLAANVSGVGGSLMRVKPSTVDPFDIDLAPRAEQHRIVESIESYFTRLDDAMASLERVQRNLKRYRASVLNAAVEGRLVPNEAELARADGRDYEPASVLLERILSERRRRWEEGELAKMTAKGKAPKDDKWKAKYLEPVAPDTSELPELPTGWCWASVDQLTSRVTSGSRDWTQYYGRGDSVFLMAQNVRPGQLDLSFQQVIDPPPEDPSRERSQVRPHDLLVTIVGANTGNVCRVPSELARHYVCQSVALMRPVEVASSHYLDVFLNSPPGQQVYAEFMYGQGRPHLSFDNLRETFVPLPPTAEQTRIRAAVERQISVVDDAGGSISLEVARCARLRQSILKWAFEGRLVDQDPADEPASKLLERIKSERAAEPARSPNRRPRRSTSQRMSS